MLPSLNWDKRTRIGDWESGNVIGKGRKGIFVTLADRFNNKTLIAPVPSKHANVVRDAIVHLLLLVKVQTLTFDNGKESACHADIKETLGSDKYFTYLYHLWERELNENHNDLIC